TVQFLGSAFHDLVGIHTGHGGDVCSPVYPIWGAPGVVHAQEWQVAPTLQCSGRCDGAGGDTADYIAI
ncbi:MAG: hypothetical protein AB7L92_09105, partial [Alphaproteobacteria bacterium]